MLNPKILHNIDGVSYLDMPKFLEDEIENEERVSMFPVHEYWLDIGQMDQFKQAQQDSNKFFE